MAHAGKTVETTTREFFHAKKKKAGSEIDWPAKKAKWIKAVENLYKRVTGEFLAAPIKTGDLKHLRSPKTLVEEYVGQYEIDELILQVGDERAVFSPKGLNIVGAMGRVDLIGERGERTLVFQPGDRWGIVVSRTPTLKVIPLDQESLLESLKDIMRP